MKDCLINEIDTGDFLKNKNITVRVYESDEMFRKIYGDGGAPKYPHLQSNIKYFNFSQIKSPYVPKEYDSYFVVAENKESIIGIALVSQHKFSNPESNTYFISYVSVMDIYQDMGISKKISELLFRHFSERCPNEKLETSSYSIMGWDYIRHTHNELAIKYNVNFIDDETCPFYMN